MRLFALLWALCIGMTAAQLRGSDGSVRGLAGAPAPPSTGQLGSPPDTSSTTCTEAGQFLPGPTCTSFYVCLNIYGSKVRFECAPGTMFSLEIGVCVHSYGTECAAGASPAPVPIAGPIVSPVPPPGPPPVPQTPPPPPLPPITGTTSPPTQTCPAYELDPSGVYDCLEEGYFPHLSDCTRFYKCINTMGCILKGVLFRCPANYLFTDGRCQKESIVGPCNRQSDSVQTHQIRPVAQLNLQNMDDFFKSSAYWQVMEFLPEEPQVLVPIMQDFSRGSEGRLTMG